MREFKPFCMHLNFDGGTLNTDYYSSDDCNHGVPWILVIEETWHVLLPHPPRRPLAYVRALPVKDRSDAEGWRWRLELGEWHLPCFRRCFTPSIPPYPEKGQRFERVAVLYGGYPLAAFQRPAGEGPVLQPWGRPTLWLVRGA